VNNQAYDVRFHHSVLAGAASTALTAGGSGDATAINGPWVAATDYHAVAVGVSYTATIASTKVLDLACIVETASDSSGTGAATLATLTTLTVAALATPGTDSGVLLFAENVVLDKSTNKGYIRQTLTPNLSASGTDTARVSGFFITGPHKTSCPNP
jgi:hypothetical protein